MDFITSDFTTLSDEDTMSKAAGKYKEGIEYDIDIYLECILRKGELILPITNEDMIVGVLTRSDLLLWILNEPSRFSSSVAPDSDKDAAKSQFYYCELMKAK